MDFKYLFTSFVNLCRSLGIQEFTKWAFPAAMATPNSTSGHLRAPPWTFSGLWPPVLFFICPRTWCPLPRVEEAVTEQQAHPGPAADISVSLRWSQDHPTPMRIPPRARP